MNEPLYVLPEGCKYSERPFYITHGWLANQDGSGFHVARPGWYQWIDRGLIYLGESILEAAG